MSWHDDGRESDEAFLDRLRGRALPAAQEVIDLPVPRPEHARAAAVGAFFGSYIGVAAVYAVAGSIWAARGVAWAVRFTAARWPSKEV